MLGGCPLHTLVPLNIQGHDDLEGNLCLEYAALCILIQKSFKLREVKPSLGVPNIYHSYDTPNTKLVPIATAAILIFRDTLQCTHRYPNDTEPSVRLVYFHSFPF